MKTETAEKLKNLARELRVMHDEPLGGTVLLIGGESSTVGVRPAVDALRRQVLLNLNQDLTEQQLNSMEFQKQIDQFENIWSGWGNPRKLVEWRQLQKNLQPTKGHSHLALLLKERYFPVILTSTVDQLIESVFIASAVDKNKLVRPWSILVNNNERDTARNISTAIKMIGQPAQETILVKLCGDFQSRTAALTGDEVKERAEKIKKVLEDLLDDQELNLIVIGLTPLDDMMIQHFPSVSGKVTFIGRSRANFPFFLNHDWRRNPEYIIDDDLTFDLIFQTIAERLEVLRTYEQATGKIPDSEVLTQVDEEVQQEEGEKRQDQSARAGDTVDMVARLLKAEREKEERARQQAIAQSMRGDSSSTATRQAAPATSGAVPGTPPLIELLDDDIDFPMQADVASVELVEVIKNTIFTIRVMPNNQVSFDVKGISNYSSRDSKVWNVDLEGMNQYMQAIGYDIATYHRLADPRGHASWRQYVKREGINLYNDLIQGYSDLDRNLAIASKATASDPQNFTLVFNGPRSHLGIPYELLHDGQGAPFVIRYPLCRQVSGVNVRHPQTFERFVRELRQKRQRLRVLLIASDVDSRPLTVDQEIDEVRSIITFQAQRLSLQVDFELLPSAKSNIKEVRKRLENCTYHIVHFAGHGGYDETSSENSGLHLWQQGFRGREKVILTARELASLLSGSVTRLFYLNNCVGASTGSERVLPTNDYLGIMDAIVMAGIPYVFGFRWYVPDASSREFARQFYEKLFVRPLSPERAVWLARRQYYNEKGTADEIWTSPILVAQNTYLAQ